MIELSRMNGKTFYLNCDLIQALESTPDTLVTLTNGEKFMVKETVNEVVAKTMEYRKRLYQEPPSENKKTKG
jgi:flagellar protein FlbD